MTLKQFQAFAADLVLLCAKHNAELRSYEDEMKVSSAGDSEGWPLRRCDGKAYTI